MRKLYITTVATLQNYRHSMSGAYHYVDLGDGTVIASAIFRDDTHEENFESDVDVTPMPHPQFEATTTMSTYCSMCQSSNMRHVPLPKLTDKFGVISTDTVHDVSAKVSAVHPEVRVRRSY